MKTRSRGLAALAAAMLVGAAAPIAQADDIFGRDAAMRSEIRAHLASGDDAAAAATLDAYFEGVPEAERDARDGELLWEATLVHCRLGDVARADVLLLDAVKAGFVDFSRMYRAPEARVLRGAPRFSIIMDARESADELLIERQVGTWTGRAPEGAYARGHDPERKLHLLAGPGFDLEEVRPGAAAVADRLASLFGPLRLGVLIVLPRVQDLPSAFDSRHVRGRYRKGPRELVVLDARRSLAHELVHAFHHDHMDRLGQQHPLWVQEGLATLFESVDTETADAPDGRGAFVFRSNERDGMARRLAELGRLTPWSTLLTDEPGPEPALVYPQVRAVVHFLADRGLLEAWYAAYTETFAHDATGRLALERVVGAPIDEVERAWHAWVLTRPLSVEVVQDAVPRVREPRILLPVEPVEPVESEADAAAELVSTLRHDGRDAYGRGAYDEAIAAFERLLEIAPDHADARYELALAAVRGGHLALAETQHARLRALDPSLASLLGNLLREPPSAPAAGRPSI